MKIEQLNLKDYKKFCLPLIKRTMPDDVYKNARETLPNKEYLDIRRMYGIKVKDQTTGQERLASFSGWVHWDGEYWISWTATDPEFQGKGLCSMILNRIFEDLRDAGVKRVSVETYEHPNFYNALIFYMKLGFRMYELTPDHLSDGSTMIFLGKNL